MSRGARIQREDVSPWRKERKLATVCNESAKRERISGSGKFAWLESCNLREKGITRETTCTEPKSWGREIIGDVCVWIEKRNVVKKRGRGGEKMVKND